MAYIYLQHKNFPVAEVGVNSPIPFELSLKDKHIGFDGDETVIIKESGVYAAHWHIPARLKEVLGVTPLGLLDGSKRNILLSLTKNGNIIGASAVNVDERTTINNFLIDAIIKALQESGIDKIEHLANLIDTADYNLKQEYSEIVSGVCIFKANKGDRIKLKNHSFTGIEIPTHSNSAQCPICAGGSFAVYKIDDYDPCVNPCDAVYDDDDDVLGGCCND